MSPDAAPTFLSVVVRTQGRRPRSLGEALDSLAAQEPSDLEILLVPHASDEAGSAEIVDAVAPVVAASAARDLVRIVPAVGGGRSRPLNVGLAAARGRYVAFLDDDDLALPGWVATFRSLAERHPARMLRAATLSQRWTTGGTGSEPQQSVGEPFAEFADRFDLLAHLDHNHTPICSVALPLEEVRRRDLRFDEDLPVLEDWDLFMRAALELGVADSAAATSLYRRLDAGNSDEHGEDVWRAAHAAVLERLDAAPLVLPPGSAKRLAALAFRSGGGPAVEDRLTGLEAQLAAASAEVDRIRSELEVAQERVRALESSTWWRLTAPLRAIVDRVLRPALLRLRRRR